VGRGRRSLARPPLHVPAPRHPPRAALPHPYPTLPYLTLISWAAKRPRTFVEAVGDAREDVVHLVRHPAALGHKADRARPVQLARHDVLQRARGVADAEGARLRARVALAGLHHRPARAAQPAGRSGTVSSTMRAHPEASLCASSRACKPHAHCASSRTTIIVHTRRSQHARSVLPEQRPRGTAGRRRTCTPPTVAGPSKTLLCCRA
jgi:hypothetical protein